MDKNKIICFVVIILVLSLTVNKLNINKVNNGQEIKEVTQNIKVNKKQFAMYIKENGEYKEYTNSDTFPEGYVIDKNMSKCYDAEDQEISGITFTGNSNNITVTSGKTAYCYLYFDKPAGGNQILDNLPTNSGLSASKLGDMRRYQGANAKNYICINDTGIKCNSGSNEMYRIIGIVEDGEEAGQIKVIKETKYGNTHKWNNNSSTSQCSGTTCSWPNNDLAKTLNTTFLQSLPTKVQDKIVLRQWYYGDLEHDHASGITKEQTYQTETGQINTYYYDISTGKHITTEKWQKTSETRKIGLMYLHDYMLQTPTATNCGESNSSYESCRYSGWMHIARNEGGSEDYEWTMTRIGRDGYSSTIVSAWCIHPYGYVDDYYLSYAHMVRPVFYLSSDVRIKEGGTGEKTNPYILDLS